MSHDAYSALSDPTRRRILEALRGGSRPVGELVAELEVSQPTVSKHLKVLRDAHMVVTRAEGQKRFYSLTAEPLVAVVEWLEDLVEASVASAPAEPAVEETVGAAEPVEPVAEEPVEEPREEPAEDAVAAPRERALPWFTAEVTDITETVEDDVVAAPEDEAAEGEPEESAPRDAADEDGGTEEEEASEDESAEEPTGPESALAAGESQVTDDSVGADVHAVPAARPQVEDDEEPRDVAPRPAAPETSSPETAELLRPRGGAHRRQSGLLSTLTGFRRRGRGVRRD